jgi:hypothetical protein
MSTSTPTHLHATEQMRTDSALQRLHLVLRRDLIGFGLGFGLGLVSSRVEVRNSHVLGYYCIAILKRSGGR